MKINKDDLTGRSVKLLFHNRIVEGKVYGRKLAFPIVAVKSEEVQPAYDFTVEFSWPAIYRAVHENHILKI